MTAPSPTAVELDDIIFRLQPFGGISEYWREVTSRLAGMPQLRVRHLSPPSWQRPFRHKTLDCVFHSSYFRVARGRAVQNVLTVHDMAYELGHVGSGLRALVGRMERRRAYLAAEGIVCISEATRRDLLTLFPSVVQRALVRVAHHGIGPAPAAIPRESLAPLNGHSGPYVLHVGGRGHYKNFPGALHGFRASGLVAEGFSLLCTGAPFSVSEARLIHQLGLQDSVHALGNVSRDHLHSLYVHAHALLYASLFEGFGLPLLEAMRAGCPVVASNASALPEVAGNAALLVDARDPAAIAAALLASGRVDVRAGLIERGLRRVMSFSWGSSAQAHAQLYRELNGAR